MKHITLLKPVTTGALIALGALGTVLSTPVQAQENGALIDALIRKKVLTAQEAENIRTELVRESLSSNANKLKIADSVTSMSLFGDMRVRFQYDNKQGITEAGHGSQRTRERLRLRLGSEFQLDHGFFGGVQLQTTQNSDSGNQTMAEGGDAKSAGFNNYNIYISRAFIGWKNDTLRLVAGKQANPFYTTDMVWDPDINPPGFSEKVDLLKLFRGEVLSDKDGVVAASDRFDLSLVAGQFIFMDNAESGANKLNNSDVWLFATQLVGRAKITPNVRVTLAPGFMTYTWGEVSGISNETPYAPVGKYATRDLAVLTAPGDVSFKIGDIKAKALWDLAYNLQGKDRMENAYGMTSHSTRDNLAWLLGVQLGENKRKGDWSLFCNYRQTGLAAVDPNLNDSDFALGKLNTQGFKFGAAYNLGDSCVLAATYYDAYRMRKGLEGGDATGGAKLSDQRHVQVLQLDLNLKF